jgi:hypothetical protein
MALLPESYRPQGSLALSRRDEKALARRLGITASELIAVDHTVLVERAKVRGLGHVVRDAVDEAGQIADDVVACAERNPLAGQLAGEVAVGARRAISERIELANGRLG